MLKSNIPNEDKYDLAISFDEVLGFKLAQNPKSKTQISSEVQELLKKRDEFIAQRIEETLKEGEIGVLFIGLMHRVDEILRADISVSYLIYHLPFKRNFEIKKVYG